MCKGFGNTVMLRHRHVESGIQHAQRREEGLPQMVAQALAGHHFDQPPQYIGGTSLPGWVATPQTP